MLHSKPVHIYLETMINNIQVNFVVDTGAQRTSVAEVVARETAILRAVDEKLQTEIVGVGKDRTMGFVHSCDLCIGNEYFPVHCDGRRVVCE